MAPIRLTAAVNSAIPILLIGVLLSAWAHWSYSVLYRATAHDVPQSIAQMQAEGITVEYADFLPLHGVSPRSA